MLHRTHLVTATRMSLIRLSARSILAGRSTTSLAGPTLFAVHLRARPSARRSADHARQFSRSTLLGSTTIQKMSAPFSVFQTGCTVKGRRQLAQQAVCFSWGGLLFQEVLSSQYFFLAADFRGCTRVRIGWAWPVVVLSYEPSLLKNPLLVNVA